MLSCRFCACVAGSVCLSGPPKKRYSYLNRRQFLQYCQGASLAFLPSKLPLNVLRAIRAPELAEADEQQIHPQYRVKLGIEDVLRKVPAGYDQFQNEKYQDEISKILNRWAEQLRSSSRDVAAIAAAVDLNFGGFAIQEARLDNFFSDGPFRFWRAEYVPEASLGAQEFLAELRDYLRVFSRILTAEFQITRIESTALSTNASGIQIETTVRFELVGTGDSFHREQRIGNWEMTWIRLSSSELHLHAWRAGGETRGRSSAPAFVDITESGFGAVAAYGAQLLPGTDYWRTVVDGASGIDIYGHNGVSVADIDNDGHDDLYICQPAGLPNRLFRNRGDGSFEDITEAAGVGVLENSACALFADIDNDGRQDLIVVRATGPLLFLNQGGRKFRLKPDAFHFASPPQGTFVGAAIADYDRDGWLDIYFCLYSYYQGLDQYRYPMPYYDAENGPPNFLMRNSHDGTFRDVTRESGLNKNNTRFSFCCAWGDANGDGWPDLYVVNDFGRKNLYKNNGDGTFADVAPEMGVEDIGAGMSACWADFNNDGREDIYVADMWTAAGIRVSAQQNFQPGAPSDVLGLYRKHSMGNCLFQNRGDRFEDAGMASGTTFGRWAWSSDAWDFNHDGYPDLYIANGMISGAKSDDLNSFFWRQVVAYSPNQPIPSHEYEQGWNAINEVIRSDHSWSGFERNVAYLNSRNGTFTDVSGIAGLDFSEDSRTFALGDFDGDGRLEVVLKNRNGPQLRLLKNVIPNLPPSISFRLTGTKSSRDAIGARITVETDAGQQTRSLQCGSGFLAQHTKETFFGLGSAKSPVQATIRWPSGSSQVLRDLPANHRIWVEEGKETPKLAPFNSFAVPARIQETTFSPEKLPHEFETWLLVPVPAPNLSLADQNGHVVSLLPRAGKPALVCFFSEKSPKAREALDTMQRIQRDVPGDALEVFVINADLGPPNSSQAVGGYNHFAFPVLSASPDALATYNLLFRQLFERHRDMTVPGAFLIDASGNIVRIYQGMPKVDRIETDFRSIPRNEKERVLKALPFAGLTDSYEFERNYLSLGFLFFQRGYVEQAEGFFRQAAKDDPDSAEALYGLGSSYLDQKKNAQARDCFERTLKLRASYPGTIPNAWNNLGIVATREDKTDEAIDYFQHTLDIDPKHVIALQNLGNAYRQKRDWPSARKALERALALSPEDPEANYSIGMVYAQQNNAEQAYEHLQKAIAARPAYPEALNNLGILYLRTRRPEEAKRSFEEAIRVAPQYDQSYLNLARVYAIEGDRDSAKAVLQSLLKAVPSHEQAQQELKQLE